MWSLQASLHLPGVALLQRHKSPARNLGRSEVAGGSASILGVGHFTVPPDVIVEGPAGVPASNRDDTGSWSTIRTIVVPHGIAAVPRRSPIKARKRTPWRSAPEAHGTVERADRREWFADRLIVESKQKALAGRLHHLGDGARGYRDSRAALSGRAGGASRPDAGHASALTGQCIAANAGHDAVDAGRRRVAACAEGR